MNVLRVLTVSVAFFGNFATISNFPKTEKRIRKPVSVSEKTQDLNVLRCPAVLVAFNSNLLHLPSFEKLKKKSKNTSLFQKQPKTWTFWEVLLFSDAFISTLFPLAFYKIFVFYFLKIHVFFSRKANFARFEKLYYFSRNLRQICNTQHI